VGRNLENVNYETTTRIENGSMKHNPNLNNIKYDNVLVILNKESKFCVEKVKTNSVKMSKE
jgi:hypothetical protein